MNCKKCDSQKVVKIGKIKGVQRYKCKECKATFLENDNFDGMRTQKHVIAVAIGFYFDGMSVRKIQEQIAYIFKVEVSQVTIHKWIMKYSNLVYDYVSSLKVEFGDNWHVDETAIKIKGNQHWFWEMIDEDTRFMVAGHLSKTRTNKDCTILFQDAATRAVNKPRFIFADGCFAYRKPFNKVFYERCNKYTELIQNVGINSRRTNNIVERLHGSLKDMLRARRGLDSMEKTELLLKGWFVHYNFLRPHSTLKGKTPAQAAGLDIDVSNKWESLIDQATKWQATQNGVRYCE
ncbi:IS6 family transposase [Methanolobus vulcani]|uniref:IS6 family transposase n=1 Tax=Methanolobus vulcani TaxID=38026 RepID=A0A7Z8P0X5_9EURY|nr:IS6 family transposase [Methanolobus vulcani]TQD24977.1 IS6 family transposase [Methanolobus vulcani]